MTLSFAPLSEVTRPVAFSAFPYPFVPLGYRTIASSSYVSPVAAYAYRPGYVVYPPAYPPGYPVWPGYATPSGAFAHARSSSSSAVRVRV